MPTGIGIGISPYLRPNGGGSNPIDNRFELTYDDILNAPVADPNDVDDWNTLFSLPAFFTDVDVTGNVVTLTPSGFGQAMTVFDYMGLIGINDYAGCFSSIVNSVFDGSALINIYCKSVTVIGVSCFTLSASLISASFPGVIIIDDDVFSGCVVLTTTNFPLATTIKLRSFKDTGSAAFSFPSLTTLSDGSCFDGSDMVSISSPLVTSMTGVTIFRNCNACAVFSFPLLASVPTSTFQGCTSATDFYLPACTALGSSTGNNTVFLNTTGATIDLTITAGRMTCNAGAPDGDIVYLQANNTVSVITT